jgi:c-di-GMP-binding flagellar brake protein YcgR
MGRLLDANVNSTKRREERIDITSETLRKLNIVAKETAVFIQAVPRRCILRDISFSGAKIIMMGIARFLVDKEAILRIDFDDPRQSFLLKGTFIRAENIEGKKELIALAIQFAENTIPMGYKIRINEYLGTVRAESRTGGGRKAPGEHSKDPAQFSIPDQ